MNMKKGITTLAICASFLYLSACATPHVVTEKRISDEDLDCGALASQISEAEKFEEKARDEKGVTGTNTAALLLFWPALIATYHNVGEAVDAAKERQEHLMELRKKKNC